jgi:lipopolysaccharide transport system permease protein
MRPAAEMTRLILRYRKVLAAMTRVELAKRYAGSAFGFAWVFLQPALLLATYLFVYMVVFKVRFPGYSRLDYVLFVFCGLVPYLGFMEAATAGCLVVKQNIHLIKNVMVPIEIVPVRGVLVSMAGQVVATGIVLLLVAAGGRLSLHVLWLPAVMALQILLLIGLVWVLSALTVALPDVSYFVNLGVLLLMFLSPIAFTPDMVPPAVRGIVYLNPIHYMTEVYRDSMLYGRWPTPVVAVVYTALCLGSFVAGSAFFRTFKDVLVDYE